MKKIDLSEHPDFFYGCTAPGERMSSELLNFYHSPEKTLLRAECSSGVRIRFATDADEIVFSMKFGTAVRAVYSTDIILDNDASAITVHGAGKHSVSLHGKSEKTVVIHFPHLLRVESFELEIPDCASIWSAFPYPGKLLFCGDSIFQGMTSSSPSRAFAPKCAASLGMDFHNTAVGGARMNPVPVRLTAELDGDLLIAGFGVNDAITGTGWKDFEFNTSQVFKELAAFGHGKSWLITPIPNLNSSTPRLAEYRAVIRNMASGYPGVNLIDGFEIFPALPEFYIDGTHPNDAGMAHYAKQLSHIIKGDQ